MADLKISALPASTTPLAGTEVLPVVQGGTTKKVAVSDLTAGRAVAFSSFTSTGGNVMADNTLLTWGNQGQGVQGINSGGILRFYGSYAEQARISSAGFFVTNGDVQIGTAGKGIDFSANSHAAGMTSELLNDYEEGDFTPALAVASGSLTYAVQGTPRYTKIGRLVNAYGYINVSSVNLPSGALTITGLPYASFGYAAVTLTLFTGGFTQAYSGYLSNGGTTISIPNLNASIMVGGENIMFNATYTV